MTCSKHPEIRKWIPVDREAVALVLFSQMSSAVIIEPQRFVAAPSSEEAQRALRADLRRQIGVLERAACGLIAEAHPHDLGLGRVAGGPARLMSAGELEAHRDRLAHTLEDGRRQLGRLRAQQEESRGLIERMLADPGSYRWVRVSREQAGLPGCGHWHVVPRFGPVGLLTGWWRVKISSGCPLPGFIG